LSKKPARFGLAFAVEEAAYPWPRFEEKTVPSKENRLFLRRDYLVEGKPPIPETVPSKENRL
jgi:hypothetical protein